MDKRIQQLPLHLANQIAAGEVIERPASVLKELLENSLDAGCTQIEITVEQGGIGLIRVQDNGRGICKEDLALAIAPHATSKIASLTDLEEVISYGFRGEALASISAVSRLRLCSSQQDQEFGWSIEREGRDEVINMMPTPKSPGTLVEVRDLFFNTPARRHFLRSEKTEMNYLEEVFKRVALSQPQVAFKFQAGDQLQKRLPICRTIEAESKRVALLCGQSFIDQSYYIQVEANGLTVKGWLGTEKAMRGQADLQYFYVNGRIVRDKVVMHAIRQAYQDICLPGRYPAYVLFFELDPKAVDVNVHPTKHEVRFREARRVHAFLSYAIKEGLKQGEAAIAVPTGVLPSKSPQTGIDFSFLANISTSVENDYLPQPKQNLIPAEKNSLGKPIGVIGQEFLLTLNEQGLVMVDIKAARRILLKRLLQESYQAEGVSKRPLLMPKSFAFGKSAEILENPVMDWEKLGFEMSQIGHDLLLVRTVPVAFGSKVENLIDFLRKLLLLQNVEQCLEFIVEFIITNDELSESQIKQLLVDVLKLE